MAGKQDYSELVGTPIKVLKSFLRSGCHVIMSGNAGVPQALIHALPEATADLRDIEITSILTLGAAPYVDAKCEKNMRHTALFIGANVRKMVQEGHADYTPVFLHEQPRLIRSGLIPVDVVLLSTTPPDHAGFMSLGVSIDIMKAAIDRGKYVIAEANKQMPRTHGDSFIHVSDVDAIVEADYPLPEAAPSPPTEEAIQIGKYVAAMIQDGSTLQLGIGGIPDAVLAQLGRKKDLGIHTEMFSDGAIPLIESGVINCKAKTINAGRAVAAFCFGTRRLYEYIDDNPFFSFHPVDYTNDPFVIARHDRMVSVNSCLQVDITGQVCSDSIGTRFYSGFGGQVDFVRGASRSNGGMAILAAPATAKDGAISRIVPMLTLGAGVVTSRADVQYVVTEYGVANLHGRPVSERVLSLIAIAHPKFRGELMEEARRMKFVPKTQIGFPENGLPYPVDLITHRTLKDGLWVKFRPAKPADERLLKDLFYSHSRETIQARYREPIDSLSLEEFQRFTIIDYDKEMTILATIPDAATEEIIGVARYRKEAGKNEAEFDLVVHDDYQSRGLGAQLLGYLIEVARSCGINGFTGQMLTDNSRMLHLLETKGAPIKTTMKDGIISARLSLSESGKGR